MAIHSSILAWRIPWTEEPGGLQSVGSQRVRHDGVTNMQGSVHINWLGKASYPQSLDQWLTEPGGAQTTVV